MKRSKTQKLQLGKASDGIITDYLKSGIKFLLNFTFKLIWNIYGVAILAGLTILLLTFEKWLQIPITWPAYVVATVIVTSMLVVLFISWVIRTVRLRTKVKMFDGFLWRVNGQGEISGPICPACKNKEMTTISSVDEQLGNAAMVIFGESPQYTFICGCGHKIPVNKSKTELLRELQIQISSLEEATDHSKHVSTRATDE